MNHGRQWGFAAIALITLELGARLPCDDFEETAGETLSGRISLPDGSPVAGAIIETVLLDPDDWAIDYEKVEASGTSDQEGQYRISSLQRGLYWVGVRVEREAPRADGVEGSRVLALETWLSAHGSVRLPGPAIDFVVEDGHQIQGRVLDERGKPVESYRLSVLSVDHPPITRGHHGYGRASEPLRIARERVSAPSGEFSVQGIPGGEWELLVKSHGHTEGRVKVRVPHPEKIVVSLDRDARLSGIVVGAGGRPVRRAHVEAFEAIKSTASWDFDLSDAVVRTDSNGRFELELSPGRWRLLADAKGHGQSDMQELHLGVGEQRDDFRMVLSRHASVRVTLPSDVHIRGSAAVTLQSKRERSSTNARIRPGESHEFERLDPGVFNLKAHLRNEREEGSSGRVDKDVWFLDEVRVSSGERVEVVLGEAANLRGVHVRGRVTLGNIHAAGANLQWRCNETGWAGAAVSDATGVYRLSLKGGPSFHVRVASAGDGWASYDVELTQGASHVVQDFELPTGSISGRLFPPPGSVLGGVHVTAIRREDAEIVSWTSSGIGPDGSFTIRPLGPGSYHLFAKPTLEPREVPEGSGIRIGRFGVADFGELRVDGVQLSQGDRLEDMNLHLPPPATIRVRLRDPKGDNVYGAAVRITYADEFSTGPWMWPRTDVWGRAEVQGLGPGSYIMHAELDESVSDRIRVELEEGEMIEVELHLRP